MLLPMILMLCSGAGLGLASMLPLAHTAVPADRMPVRLRTRSVKGSGALVLLLLVSLAHHVVGTICVHCKDSIPGCAGGDACPLVTTTAANVAAIAASSITKVPKLDVLLPPDWLATFTRQVSETVVGIACAPAQGTSIDFTGAGYTGATTVVNAFVCGHCTSEDASLELGRRLEGATEALAVDKLKAAIDLLRVATQKFSTTSHTQAGYGVYTFVWAKIGAHIDALSSGVLRIANVPANAKSSSHDLTVKFRRPANEQEFYYRCHWFVRIISSLGIISFICVHQFIEDVVWYTIHRIQESWQVASELLLVYWDAIHNDPSRQLNLANVYRRGAGDTYLAEARRNAAMFFRPPAEGRRTGAEVGSGSATKWNGSFTPTSKKPCIAFNLNQSHGKGSLDEAGCCQYNHVCMQWVSDKGPGGMCLGKHRKSDCDYDPAKKLAKELK